jgi:hypothetical protein
MIDAMKVCESIAAYQITQFDIFPSIHKVHLINDKPSEYGVRLNAKIEIEGKKIHCTSYFT